MEMEKKETCRCCGRPAEEEFHAACFLIVAVLTGAYYESLRACETLSDHDCGKAAALSAMGLMAQKKWKKAARMIHQAKEEGDCWDVLANIAIPICEKMDRADMERSYQNN